MRSELRVVLCPPPPLQTDPLQNPSLCVCSYMKVESHTNYTPDTFEAELSIFRKRLYA